MNCGVVPTKYGYSLVCLPPYDNNWVVHTPVEIPKDLDLIMQSEILRKLAIYCHQLFGWQGQLKNFLPWAIWGGLVLWLRLSSYASMGGWKTIALYGWVMFLFFGDGLFHFMQWLHQIPNLIRVRQIKRMDDIKITYRITHRPEGLAEPGVFSEREYIQTISDLYPETKPYYDEMLRKEPPIIFSLWPIGLLGYVRYLTQGPRIPRPALVVELGSIE